MPQTVQHPMGKHPVYLQMPHELFLALEAYRKRVGRPRATVIFEVLRGFLGPMSSFAPDAEYVDEDPD